MNLSLEGKLALVCGSSQGIGLAIAVELALLGAECILVARNEDKLKQAVSSLPVPLRQQHSYRAADFSRQENVSDLAQRVTTGNTIHILVNNSGGPASGPIMAATPDQFAGAFSQHLLASHILTTAVLEGMKKSGYGRIINIISTSVKIPLKNLGVSNTVRGAMASWAKTMANEAGRYNITVNNILPGFTKTERLESIIENMAGKKGIDRSGVERQMLDEVPAGRFGDAAEIAAVAAFLATPAASYVNGTSIPVDGGRTGSI